MICIGSVTWNNVIDQAKKGLATSYRQDHTDFTGRHQWHHSKSLVMHEWWRFPVVGGEREALCVQACVCVRACVRVRTCVCVSLWGGVFARSLMTAQHWRSEGLASGQAQLLTCCVILDESPDLSRHLGTGAKTFSSVASWAGVSWGLVVFLSLI